MKIPELSGLEFLVEEGRLPGLLYSLAAFLATVALVVVMLFDAANRGEIIGDMTVLISILSGAGTFSSAWKTYIKAKHNGNGNGNGNGTAAH